MSDEGKVIPMRGLISRLPVDPDEVLEACVGNMKTVLVIGWDNEGEEYFASSTPDGGDLLWLMERFKHGLINGDFEA